MKKKSASQHFPGIKAPQPYPQYATLCRALKPRPFKLMGSAGAVAGLLKIGRGAKSKINLVPVQGDPGKPGPKTTMMTNINLQTK